MDQTIPSVKIVALTNLPSSSSMMKHVDEDYPLIDPSKFNLKYSTSEDF